MQSAYHQHAMLFTNASSEPPGPEVKIRPAAEPRRVGFSVRGIQVFPRAEIAGVSCEDGGEEIR